MSISLLCFALLERQWQILRDKHSVIFVISLVVVVSLSKFSTNSIGPSGLLQLSPKFNCALKQCPGNLLVQLPLLKRHRHSPHMLFLLFSGGPSLLHSWQRLSSSQTVIIPLNNYIQTLWKKRTWLQLALGRQAIECGSDDRTRDWTRSLWHTQSRVKRHK